MSYSVRIKVPANLKQHKEIIDQALNTGVQRSIAMVTNEAITKAPRRTGTLKRSIHSEVATALGTFTGKVIQDQGVAKYGPFVEFGTGIYGPNGRPITPKTKKFLSWMGKNGKRVFARSVKGMRERPYMRPALQDNIGRIGEIITEEIQKAVVKLGG